MIKTASMNVMYKSRIPVNAEEPTVMVTAPIYRVNMLNA
jgi:hypothetical protein